MERCRGRPWRWACLSWRELYILIAAIQRIVLRNAEPEPTLSTSTTWKSAPLPRAGSHSANGRFGANARRRLVASISNGSVAIGAREGREGGASPSAGGCRGDVGAAEAVGAGLMPATKTSGTCCARNSFGLHHGSASCASVSEARAHNVSILLEACQLVDRRLERTDQHGRPRVGDEVRQGCSVPGCWKHLARDCTSPRASTRSLWSWLITILDLQEVLHGPRVDLLSSAK